MVLRFVERITLEKDGTTNATVYGDVDETAVFSLAYACY